MNATESDVSLSTTDPELVTHELTYGDQRLTIANFASDQLINTSLAADGSWEPWQLKLMSRAVRPDFTCVDIGANIGINALFMSRCCPQGRVFAFEPFDRIYAVLRRNVELNHTSNLTAINKGISSKTQSLNMVTDMRSVGGAHIAEPGATGGDVVGGTFHFARLDDELRAQGVDKVDFIKIDVEGHELHVLDSAASFLSNADLQLAIEYNPPLLRITAPDPSVPFVDRRLFDRLRLSFQRMFFMNRDGTLVELADYHALRRCLLGGYFVDDMYCTNHVPAELVDMINPTFHAPAGLPVSMTVTPSFTATWYNRGEDGWTSADSHSPATASLAISGGAASALRLRFDPIYKKHLEDGAIASWPVHVLVGDAAVTLDLLDAPREVVIYVGERGPSVTIEADRSAPASSYLGNPADTRRVGFKCDVHLSS